MIERINYHKLGEDTLYKLQELCEKLFVDFKKVRVRRSGKVVFIRKQTWFCRHGIVKTIPELLLKEIPDMLSICKWNTYDVSKYYSIEISRLIKQNYTDELSNLREIIDYLYLELTKVNLINIRGDLNTVLEVPTILRKALSSRRGKKLQEIVLEEEKSSNQIDKLYEAGIYNNRITIYDIAKEQKESLTALWYDFAYGLKRRMVQTAIIAMVYLVNPISYPTLTGIAGKLLSPLYGNHYSYYFNST